MISGRRNRCAWMNRISHKVSMNKILVIAGAGLSAESGIPTFRGAEGYWRNQDPRELATRAAFDRNPRLVWEWYNHRRAVIRGSMPNGAHRALVELQRRTPGFLLVTQNTDDLDRRAGMSAGSMVKIHGDIFDTICIECGGRVPAGNESADLVPRCAMCGGMMRPGVVWFDEELNPQEVARVENYINEGPCDYVVVVGTSAVFDYIQDWALRAKGRGELIVIDPIETPLVRYSTLYLRGSAAKLLPDFLSRY